MNFRTQERLSLVVGCVCFTALAVALFLVGSQPPAAGYEISIYDRVPPAAWACLIASAAGGIGLIVHQAFSRRASNRWVLGFVILVMTNTIILLLPTIRGYFLYASSDTIAHTQWAQGILTRGHFEETNRYPIIHVLAAQIALVCDLPSHTVIQLLPILFSILFTSTSYLLGKVALPKHSQAILACVGGGTLFFGYYHVAAYPQGLSMMVLPLVFYLYFQRDVGPTWAFRILFVLLLLFLPFFHPATAVVLIVCLAGVEIARGVWRLRAGTGVGSGLSLSAEPTLIAWITFFTWVSAFGFFSAAIRTTFRWLQGEIAHVPRVTEIQNMFASQGLGPLDQISLALKLYGDNLFYLVSAVTAFILVVRGLWRRQRELENLFVLSAPFIISGPVWVLIFVTTLQVTLGRLLGSNAMMWTSPILASLALHKLFEKIPKMRLVAATLSLLCIAVIAIIGVYHAPFILQVSWQITHTDAEGAAWFTEHHTSTAPFATLGVPPAYILSRAEVPNHFNYQDQDTFGLSIQRDTFLLLTERFRLASADPTLSTAMISDVRLVKPGFAPGDFERLGRDPSVNKLYSSGEFDIFLIRSIP